MSAEEMDAIISEYTRRYGPVISVSEAAEISRRKKQTIYDWSSRGLLDGFRVQREGALLLSVAGFVHFLFDD